MKVSNKDIRTLRQSGQFDAQWYLDHYPDVQALGLDPAAHYLWIGQRLRRKPVAPVVASSGPGLKQDGAARPSVPVDADASVFPLRAPGTWRHLSAVTADRPDRLPVAIIVPVYNAPAETELCLRAVLRNTTTPARLIVIDDASPDPRIGEVLARYASLPAVTVVTQTANRGFTSTVNHGIELAGRSDIVMLNSDTEVTSGWLRNLQLAVNSGERIATATPFSDNADKFSAPVMRRPNELPPGLSYDDYGRLVTRASERLYPRVPTGSGYCMYVRRAAIEEVGPLDAEAFPRGYGEENDLCMRAGRAGWSHVIDDATFVHHVRTASFGLEKKPLLQHAFATLAARYPDYDAAVAAFLLDPVCARARSNVASALAGHVLGTPVLPRILYAIATRTGGTPQTNEDLMRALAGRAETFVLQCDGRTMRLYQYAGGQYLLRERHVLDVPLRAFPHRSEAYDAAARDWLIRYGFEYLHVRHIGWHSLGLIDEAEALGIPIAFSFHDFYSVCPNTKLLDENLVPCAGQCTAGPGPCRMELWNAGDYPPLKHRTVLDWREQLRPVLEKCSAFFTTSESARAQIIGSFPGLATRRFEVIPHGRDFGRFDPPGPLPAPGEKLRLLVAGLISPAKGAGVLAGLAARADELGLEIHLLGAFTDDVSPPKGIVVHGGYEREDFLDRVRQIRPHLGGVFSVWAETWCHTLTEMWAAGLPVIGFPPGAVGERLRQTGAGFIAGEMTAAGVANLIAALRRDPSRLAAAAAAVADWQDGDGHGETTTAMAEAYWQGYGVFEAARRPS